MKNTSKRYRRSKSELEALDEQIVEVLAADHPQSVRHVFYRMTDLRLAAPVSKSESGYKAVQRECLKLRRAGRIPYGWVSDSTRTGFHVETFASGGDLIREFAGLYRAQLWTENLPHVEVWCESRSLAGVLKGTCKTLAISLYPSGGFASATLAYESACEIDSRKRERAIVLYVGDYDQSGVLIDQAIERELRSHLSTPLEFRRIAINEFQIDYFGLPTRPPKTTDRRRPDITRVVEAEAMPAATMRRIVREAVEAHLPAGALDAVKVAEESERAGLRALGRIVGKEGVSRAVEALQPF